MVTYLLFAAGVVLALLGLTSRVLPSARDRLAAAALAPLLLGGFAGAMAAAGRPPSAWAPALALAGLCAALLLVRLPLARRLLDWAATPALQAGALLVAGVSVMLLSSRQTEPDYPPIHAEEPNWQPQAQRAMASLRDDESATAVTDQGRTVRLLTMPGHMLWPDALQEMEMEMAAQWGLSLQVIRTRPPDASSDCHGWVFADGRWWILGADVELILRDNGYRGVDEPEAGDLVVYRRGREITHSGIVFAVPRVPRDGPMLVESKWSWLGTYLHTPNDHPYGGEPAYYRSDRDGHRLHISEPSS